MQIRLLICSLVRALKVQIYMLITQTGVNNRGTDQSTHSHCLKGMTDADQPAHPLGFLQTTTVQISLLICKIRSQQQRSRSASSMAKSCANNDGADQPAHLRSLRLAFGMLTNVRPTRINNVGPTLNQRNLYNMSYVGPTLGQHVGPTEAR